VKIGFLLAGDFEEGNGANSRLKAYAKGLRQLGEQVELLILHASSFNHSGINKRTSGQWEGIPFRFLNGSCSRPEGRAGKIKDSLKALLFSVWFLIRHARTYDAFYFYGPKPLQAFHVYVILKLLGVPLIIEMTEKDSAGYEGIALTWPKKILRKLHSWHEKNLDRLCDHLVVISHRLFNYYKHRIPCDRLSLVPIIVDFGRFQHLNGKPSLPMRVGYIGSFGAKDGVPGIIEAFQQARSSFPDIRLRLIGHADEEASEQLQHADYQASGVEFIGQVFYRNIPDYLYSCDLLVVNRPDTAYANYGFPTKLGEYLATGRPALVTNVGDVKQYLTNDEHALIVEPDDPDQLATAIIKRYSFYQFYSDVGLAGMNLSKDIFDYRPHVETLRQIIAKAAGQATNTARIKPSKEQDGVEVETGPCPLVNGKESSQ
jgi:glycosyltransferase involved in cell wall biosynthesis